MPSRTKIELSLKLYKKAVGERIRVARRVGRLTQQQLAAVVGLNRSSIAKIEAGNQRFSIDALYFIAGQLGQNPGDFLPVLNECTPRHDATKAILKKGLSPEGLNENAWDSVVKAINSKERK